jgi:hypothetical protein
LRRSARPVPSQIGMLSDSIFDTRMSFILHESVTDAS